MGLEEIGRARSIRQLMSGERGLTLIGELIAIVIIGMAISVLLAGLSTASMGVGIVTQQVSAENYARMHMEAIKAAPYRPNPTAVPYPVLNAAGVYTSAIQVGYWVSPTFVSEMPAEDWGLQIITVTVYSSQDTGGPIFTFEGYKGERP